ncbi:hypothetical protein [Paraburkholderia caribensis]|uniref:hypothetical protein n=1 Tax=Paraburkholderia caribensis TaxID=75105 RepID=UPI0011B271A7|nr:hypothetical protein [Paraburkholderia caribensis]
MLRRSAKYDNVPLLVALYRPVNGFRWIVTAMGSADTFLNIIRRTIEKFQLAVHAPHVSENATLILRGKIANAMAEPN